MESYDPKIFEEALAENGGSDLIANEVNDTNSGEDDDSDLTEEEKSRKVYNHLNTVDSNWYTVGKELLQMFIPTGKPPSTILESEWKEIRERSLKFGVPVERRFPTIWLLLQSRKLKINQPFVLKKIAELDQLQSSASTSITGVLWILCVLKYNGYVSILKHLNRVAKDPLNQLPRDFSLQFYEYKNVDADLDDERKRTILADLATVKNKNVKSSDDNDSDEDDEEKVLEELSKSENSTAEDPADSTMDFNEKKNEDDEVISNNENSEIDDLWGDGNERFPE